MSANLIDLAAKQYATSVMLLTQQKGSRLRSSVSEGSHKGTMASPVDQIGATSMQQVTTRFGAIGRIDAPVDRRWVSPTDYDHPQLVDNFDLLKTLIDPKNPLVMNGSAAVGRKIDDVIIACLFGTALTGTNGSTSTSFSSDGGTQVTVNESAASNTNLTVAKLRKARQNLRAADVDTDNETMTCVITASQEASLLREAQVISLDYNDKPVLKNGKLESFLGFNFIHSERLGVDGSSYRRVPVYCKSGVHLGIWQDMKVSIDKRVDLSGHPWQLYHMISLGATRIEGEKVVEILCAE